MRNLGWKSTGRKTRSFDREEIVSRRYTNLGLGVFRGRGIVIGDLTIGFEKRARTQKEGQGGSRRSQLRLSHREWGKVQREDNIHRVHWER